MHTSFLTIFLALPPGLLNVGFMVLFFGVAYFFMIRPQTQQRKRQQDFVGSMNKGMRVVTIGGLHGTIVDLNDKTVTILVAEKTRLVFNRDAISMENTQAAFPNSTPVTATEVQ